LQRARSHGELSVTLADGASCVATVVIASGARYRRPACRAWPTSKARHLVLGVGMEAKLCSQQEWRWSAAATRPARRAVFLSQHAAKVNMLVRGPRSRPACRAT
jgi:thioredoxin reductase (NADPH)